MPTFSSSRNWCRKKVGDRARALQILFVVIHFSFLQVARRLACIFQERILGVQFFGGRHRQGTGPKSAWNSRGQHKVLVVLSAWLDPLVNRPAASAVTGFNDLEMPLGDQARPRVSNGARGYAETIRDLLRR